MTTNTDKVTRDNEPCDWDVIDDYDIEKPHKQKGPRYEYD